MNENLCDIAMFIAHYGVYSQMSDMAKSLQGIKHYCFCRLWQIQLSENACKQTFQINSRFSRCHDILVLHFNCRKVWSMLVKTVSWRRQSGPRYRKPTTSPRVPQTSQIPPDQMTNRMRSLFPTARVPSLLMDLTPKRQPVMKKKVPAANTHRCHWPTHPSSVCSPTVCPPPTKSLHIRKTITATRRRRAKRIIWSIQRLPPVLPALRPIPQTTAPHHLKAPDHRRSSAAKQPALSVLMTTVHCSQTLTYVFRRSGSQSRNS